MATSAKRMISARRPMKNTADDPDNDNQSFPLSFPSIPGHCAQDYDNDQPRDEDSSHPKKISKGTNHRQKKAVTVLKGQQSRRINPSVKTKCGKNRDYNKKQVGVHNQDHTHIANNIQRKCDDSKDINDEDADDDNGGWEDHDSENDKGEYNRSDHRDKRLKLAHDAKHDLTKVGLSQSERTSTLKHITAVALATPSALALVQSHANVSEYLMQSQIQQALDSQQDATIATMPIEDLDGNEYVAPQILSADVNDRPDQRTAVTKSKQSSGFIPRGKARKPKARNNTRSYQSIRFLVRRGLLPIASLDDSSWFARLQKYVDLYTSKTQIQKSANPFEELFVGRGPELTRCLPRDKCDVLDKMLNGKFENSLQDSQKELAAIVRGAMFKTACILLESDASKHERIFAQRFDAIEWVSNCKYRLMFFNVKKVLMGVFPAKEDLEKANVDLWDYTKRAMMAVDLLVLVYAGIIRLFEILWNRNTNNSFQKIGGKYIFRELYDKMFYSRTFNGKLPYWNHAWIRVLLFSLPPDPAILEDEEDKVLYDVGVNYEHICLLQLNAVMNIKDRKVLESYRRDWRRRQLEQKEMIVLNESQNVTTGTSRGPLSVSEALRIEAPGGPLLANGKRASVTAYDEITHDLGYLKQQNVPEKDLQPSKSLQSYVCEGKGEPFPWNKALRWTELLEPFRKVIDGVSHVVSSYEEQTEAIRQSRHFLTANISRVHIKDICHEAVDDENRLDRLIDMIIKRGVEQQTIQQRTGTAYFGDNNGVPQLSNLCSATIAQYQLDPGDWQLPE